MRSSIFDSEPKKGPSRSSMIRSRAASASPNLRGVKPDTTKKIPKLYKEERHVPWNVEEMLVAYQEHKLLPPMLSPDLPDFDTQKFDMEKSDISEVPLAQLTPRGSPVKSKQSKEDTGDKGSDIKTSDTKTSDAKSNDTKSNDTKSNDTKTTTTKAEEVKVTDTKAEIKPEKKDDTKTYTKPIDKPISESKSKRKSRVKWVNRMTEEPPRFLLRFSYNSETLHKQKDVTGLGISMAEQSKKSFKEIKQSPSKIGSRTSTPNPSTPISGKRSNSATPRDTGPKKVASEVKKQDEDFIKLKTYWIKLAKESKFMATQTEGILSLIIDLDSVILFTIAYDYDDKSKNRMNISPSDRYWLTLMDDVNSTLEKLESVHLKPNKLEPIRHYLSCFASLLSKFLIIILQRVNSIYQELIEKESDVSKKLELQSKALTNYNRMKEHYQKSEILCPSIDFFFKANFSTVWQNRCRNLADLKSPIHLVPISNNYYFPINNYTSLGEFVGLLHHTVKAFIDVHNNIFQEDLIYSLKSGLQGP